MNIGKTQNFFNVTQVNQKFMNNKSDNTMQEKGSQSLNRDSVAISKKGKAMNMIETLMKQKEEMKERKNELIGATLENDGDLNSIKDRLESIDEQLEGIDEQIADIMTENTTKQDKDKKIDKKQDETPKTKEEIEQERFEKVSSSSSDLETAKIVSSAKQQVAGELRVVNSQIELDKMTSSDTSESKELKAKELESKLEDLTADSFSKISEISDKMQYSDNKVDLNDELVNGDSKEESIQEKDLDELTIHNDKKFSNIE